MDIEVHSSNEHRTYFIQLGSDKNTYSFLSLGDGFQESWTWFVDYCKRMNHAIPRKQIYTPESEEYNRKEFYYNYQPLKEGEKSFDVADFCSDDIIKS